MSQSIPSGELWRYGLLALPLAFAGIPLYIHAPDFYATQLGLPLASLGGVLLMLRFIDAWQDPLIGRLSDRYASHSPSILCSAAVLLAAGMGMLFHPPAEWVQGGALFLWFGASLFFATTAHSVLSINLNSIGGRWGKSYHSRTRITSRREAIGLIGLLIAVVMPSLLQQQISKVDSFTVVTVALAALLLVSLLLFLPWYRKKEAELWCVPHPSPQQRGGVSSSFAHMPKESRRFFAIYGVSMLASSIPAVLILFFVRDYLQAESFAGAFLAIYFLAGAGAMPLWQKVSQRFGKPRAWLAAMVLAVVSFIWACCLSAGDVEAFAVICVMSGIAFGAELALPPSMLADMLAKYQQEQNASLHFSWLAFLMKSAAAVASLLVFVLLDYAGLKPGGENSEQILRYLLFSYALLPCLIKAAAAAWLYRSLLYFID